MRTVRVFRIVHKTYADAPFSGEGGLYASSRWASRGQLVTYAADSLALATLEKIAGAGQIDRLGEMVYVPAEVQEPGIATLEEDELPDEWDRRPPGHASRDLGDRWLENETSPALRVPSVTLPDSSNYVLNPSHPEFEEVVAVGDQRRLDLDPRVLDRLRE